MARAVVCRELGPPERLRLEEFPPAPLQPGQVRVAIHAAGINFPDILMAAGEYQLKPELPFTPGVEAAGEISEIGAGVTGVAPGDRVIVKMRHGGYADEAVVSPAQLTPLPSKFDYAEGATFLAAHGTAHHALIDRGELKSGEVLLVHGAGGGVGLAAVEIGKLLGASVIAAASSEAKLAVAKAKGADQKPAAMGGGRKNPPSHLAPAAAGALRAGHAAIDRAQGDRAGGADDAVIPSGSFAGVARV